MTNIVTTALIFTFMAVLENKNTHFWKNTVK